MGKTLTASEYRALHAKGNPTPKPRKPHTGAEKAQEIAVQQQPDLAEVCEYFHLRMRDGVYVEIGPGYWELTKDGRTVVLTLKDKAA